MSNEFIVLPIPNLPQWPTLLRRFSPRFFSFFLPPPPEVFGVGRGGPGGSGRTQETKENRENDVGKTVTLWRTWTPEPPRPFPFFRALNEEEVEEEEEEGEEEDNKILRFFFVTEKKKRNGPIDNRMIRSGQLPAEKKSSQKTHTGCQKKMKIYERKTLRRILLANIDAVVKKTDRLTGIFLPGFSLMEVETGQQ